MGSKDRYAGKKAIEASTSPPPETVVANGERRTAYRTIQATNFFENATHPNTTVSPRNVSPEDAQRTAYRTIQATNFFENATHPNTTVSPRHVSPEDAADTIISSGSVTNTTTDAAPESSEVTTTHIYEDENPVLKLTFSTDNSDDDASNSPVFAVNFISANGGVKNDNTSSNEGTQTRRRIEPDNQNILHFPGSVNFKTSSNTKIAGIPISGFSKDNDEANNSAQLDREDNVRWVLKLNPLWGEENDGMATEHEPPKDNRVNKKGKGRGRSWRHWKVNRNISDIHVPSIRGGKYSRKLVEKQPMDYIVPLDFGDPLVWPLYQLAWADDHEYFITPLTELTESINEIFQTYMLKVRHALDIVSLPYSYNGEVISRLKGCLWVMSRTTRILWKPEFTNVQNNKVSNLINRSVISLEHSIGTLLNECRTALKELKRHKKHYDHYKDEFKLFDIEIYLNCVDLDALHKLTFWDPIYSSNKIPHDPMVWESFPAWEKTEFAEEDEELLFNEIIPGAGAKGYRYYEMKTNKPSYEFLWFPGDKCYIKKKEEEEWYDYNQFDDNLKIDTMDLIHESAKDVVVVSKRYFFEANHFLKRRQVFDDPEHEPTSTSIIDDLWVKMKRAMKRMYKIKKRRADSARMHRFQVAVQAFYLVKTHMFRMINLLSYTINWLSKHYELVRPLSYCLTDEEARKVILTNYCVIGYPVQLLTNFFCKNLKFQRVRFPMTTQERNEFRALLKPEWKDSLYVHRKLAKIVVTCGGVFYKGWPFKKKKPSQAFYWAYRKYWKILPPPPKPETWPIIHDTIQDCDYEDVPPLD